MSLVIWIIIITMIFIKKEFVISFNLVFGLSSLFLKFKEIVMYSTHEGIQGKFTCKTFSPICKGRQITMFQGFFVGNWLPVDFVVSSVVNVYCSNN